MTALFTTTAQNSLALSAAIATALLISRTFALSLKWRHGIWVIMALALLVPFRPKLNVPSVPISPPDLSVYQAGIESSARLGRAFIPPSRVARAERMRDALQEDNEADYRAYLIREIEAFEEFTNLFAHQPAIPDVVAALSILWLFGLAGFSAYRLVAGLRFRSLAMRLSVPAGGRENEILADIARACGVKRVPTLRICHPLKTPVLTGLFRPAILLPGVSYSDRELSLLFAHELAHRQRRDNLAGLLMDATIAVHWFNPLVHMMARQFSADAELACDEWAVRDQDIDTRRVYAALILKTAHKGIFTGVALSGRGSLRKRLAMLFEKPKRKIWLTSLCAFILLGAVGCSIISTGTHEEAPTLESLAESSELVVYMPNFGDDYMCVEEAAAVFRRTYPDVNVTVERLGDRDTKSFPYMGGSFAVYRGRVAAEMMSGGGPDVFLFEPQLVDDIYKVMDAGAFLDLRNVIASDAYFQNDDFNHVVMDGAKHKGHQYIIPLAFDIPYVVASDAELERIGFDWNTTADMAAFLMEAARCLPTASENPSFKGQAFETPIVETETQKLLPCSGIELVDHERKVAVPDEGAFRAYYDALTAYVRVSGVNDNHVSLGFYRADDLVDGKYLFLCKTKFSGSNYLASTASQLKADGGGYRAGVLGTVGGGGVHASVQEGLAINANSPNALNAYNFIKIMLSDEVQRKPNACAGTPVRIASVAAHVDEQTERFDGAVADSEGKTRTHVKLTDEEKQALYALTQSPTSSSLYSSITHIQWEAYRLMYATMWPVWDGKVYAGDLKGFDECLQIVKQRLELYLHE